MFQKQAHKRNYELGGTVGKRSLFVPETLKGMTWDEVLICDMLGGVEISAERKYVQPFTFRSRATITITGNHLPRFITNGGANASGIDRRLLLLKVNKKLEESKIDVQFPEKLVAEEGPAIMMWFVQAAIEGWKCLQATAKFYGATKDKAAAAATAYKDKSNPYKGWMEKRGIVVERGARMNAHDAFHSFKAWALEENPTFRETKAEFRDNLASTYPGAISFGRYADEWVFFGIRLASVAAGGNVFTFPKVAGDVDRAAEKAEDVKTLK
jgi:phage/plasmid-associated DNA primase